MSYSASARNTATSTSGSITVVSRAQSTTVTSTIAGDVGVVAINYGLSGNFTRSWTPPSGWTLQEDLFNTGNFFGVAIFTNPNLGASLTSFSFTLALTGTQRVFGMNVIYAAFAGGGPGAGVEALVAALTNTTTSVIPSITSGTPGTIDLMVWVGATSEVSPNVPGNPTGTGTWTSTATRADGTTSALSMRMSAQTAVPGTAATASGATTINVSSEWAIIFGITPPFRGAMMAFFEK